ncbi:HNH endonuclease [Novipirellula sp. SH528]|uniref:HNH endonuclease n=1 Tax=Novipirellula sp. SH528 TaxID=3454466 RepID=UPI003FA0C648
MSHDSNSIAQRQNELRGILREMAVATESSDYYALTLTVSEDDRIVWSAQTGFVGMTETKPARELRAPCFVRGQVMLDLWRDIGTPGVAVNNRRQLLVFLQLGGNAIIDPSLVKEHFAEILEPKIVVPTGSSTSTQIENVPKTALNRAPTRKLRMHVLKRDNYRCRICGRRPETNVDIELHVHHFRPWGLGGLSIEENLMTLCHTCHDGLDPHFDMSLASIFPETFTKLNEMIDDLDSISRQHFAAVKRYQAKVRGISARQRLIEE